MSKCVRIRVVQVGEKFNRLTVIAPPFHRTDVSNPKCWYVRCRCECGNESVVEEKRLHQGKTKSCGCFNREIASKTMAVKQLVAAKKRRTHGDSTTPLYGLWHQMRSRCSNPTNQSYSRYGAKGIRVVSEWQNDYLTFKAWAYTNGYREGLTLDRIDPDQGYNPSNCRWISRSENSRYATTYRVDQVEQLKKRVKELEKCLDVIEASQENGILT